MYFLDLYYHVTLTSKAIQLKKIKFPKKGKNLYYIAIILTEQKFVLNKLMIVFF